MPAGLICTRPLYAAGPLTVTEAAARPRSGGSFVWLELDEPGHEEMRALRDGFGLHELAVEDAARAHQRPKVEAYDDFYFLVFRTARNNAALEHVLFGEVHVFLGVGFVIAIRHGDTAPLTTATARAELLKHGPAAVVWGSSTRSCAICSRWWRRSRTTSRRSSTRSSTASSTAPLYELKQQVNHSTAPCTRCAARSSRTATSRTSAALLRYFRDAADNVRRIHEDVLAQREQLNGVFDANAALISLRQSEITARQSEIIKQLTLVATVFLPLSFVVGFFGQHFGWLTDTSTRSPPS